MEFPFETHKVFTEESTDGFTEGSTDGFIEVFTDGFTELKFQKGWGEKNMHKSTLGAPHRDLEALPRTIIDVLEQNR